MPVHDDGEPAEHSEARKKVPWLKRYFCKLAHDNSAEVDLDLVEQLWNVVENQFDFSEPGNRALLAALVSAHLWAARALSAASREAWHDAYITFIVTAEQFQHKLDTTRDSAVHDSRLWLQGALALLRADVLCLYAGYAARIAEHAEAGPASSAARSTSGVARPTPPSCRVTQLERDIRVLGGMLRVLKLLILQHASIGHPWSVLPVKPGESVEPTAELVAALARSQVLEHMARAVLCLAAALAAALAPPEAAAAPTSPAAAAAGAPAAAAPAVTPAALARPSVQEQWRQVGYGSEAGAGGAAQAWGGLSGLVVDLCQEIKTLLDDVPWYGTSLCREDPVTDESTGGGSSGSGGAPSSGSSCGKAAKGGAKMPMLVQPPDLLGGPGVQCFQLWALLCASQGAAGTAGTAAAAGAGEPAPAAADAPPRSTTGGAAALPADTRRLPAGLVRALRPDLDPSLTAERRGSHDAVAAILSGAVAVFLKAPEIVADAPITAGAAGWPGGRRQRQAAQLRCQNSAARHSGSSGSSSTLPCPPAHLYDAMLACLPRLCPASSPSQEVINALHLVTGRLLSLLGRLPPRQAAARLPGLWRALLAPEAFHDLWVQPWNTVQALELLRGFQPQEPPEPPAQEPPPAQQPAQPVQPPAQPPAQPQQPPAQPQQSGAQDDAPVTAASAAAAAGSGAAAAGAQSCPYSLRCALDAGLVPALERLLRQLQDPATAAPSAADNDDPYKRATSSVLYPAKNLLRNSGVWPALLAHGSVPQVAALVATLASTARALSRRRLPPAPGPAASEYKQEQWKSLTTQVHKWCELLAALLEQAADVHTHGPGQQQQQPTAPQQQQPSKQQPSQQQPTQQQEGEQLQAPAAAEAAAAVAACSQDKSASGAEASGDGSSSSTASSGPFWLNTAKSWRGEGPLTLELLAAAGGVPLAGSAAAAQQALLASFALQQWLPLLLDCAVRVVAEWCPQDAGQEWGRANFVKPAAPHYQLVMKVLQLATAAAAATAAATATATVAAATTNAAAATAAANADAATTAAVATQGTMAFGAPAHAEEAGPSPTAAASTGGAAGGVADSVKNEAGPPSAGAGAGASSVEAAAVPGVVAALRAAGGGRPEPGPAAAPAETRTCTADAGWRQQQQQLQQALVLLLLVLPVRRGCSLEPELEAAVLDLLEATLAAEPAEAVSMAKWFGTGAACSGAQHAGYRNVRRLLRPITAQHGRAALMAFLDAAAALEEEEAWTAEQHQQQPGGGGSSSSSSGQRGCVGQANALGPKSVLACAQGLRRALLEDPAWRRRCSGGGATWLLPAAEVQAGLLKAGVGVCGSLRAAGWCHAAAAPAGVARLCGNPACSSWDGPTALIGPGGGKTCVRCRAVTYCCGVCQLEHWMEEGHIMACASIKAAREAAEAAEARAVEAGS